MNVTGQRTVQAQVFQHHFPYLFNSCFCMAQERSFTNSCCSKTIIRDQNLLKNIRPLKVPARMAGLTGIKTITQADMYQLDKNIDCTMTTITMARVYYDPTVKYSLVSMAELASLNFQFRFGKHQSSVRKPAEIHVPLVHTFNVYAIDSTGTPNFFALASISKMTNEETAHLYCSHVISEAKLIHLSKSGWGAGTYFPKGWGSEGSHVQSASRRNCWNPSCACSYWKWTALYQLWPDWYVQNTYSHWIMILHYNSGERRALHTFGCTQRRTRLHRSSNAFCQCSQRSR